MQSAEITSYQWLHDDEFPGPALAAISPDRDTTASLALIRRRSHWGRVLGDGTGRERKKDRKKFNDNNYEIDAGADGTNADNQENDDDYDAKLKKKMMMMLQTMMLMMTVIDDSGLCGQTV